MAKVKGSPSFFALSTKGRRALGSSWIFDLKLFFKLIDWPLRFKSHGMIIGFFGEPSRPMVEAIGIPSSMCVACRSPLERESRMAAQLAPLETVESMPYFLNNPFSCAITMGELSVSAMMPNFIFGASGESSLDTPPAHPRGNPANRRAIPDRPRNLRRRMAGWFCLGLIIIQA